MLRIYNLFIRLYILGFKLFSLWNLKARKGLKGRFKTIHIHDKSKPRILFHCASLGEFNTASPIIQKIQEEGRFEIILSFFSPSGYEFIKIKHPEFPILYLPFDLPHKMAKFLDVLKPDLVCIIQYEYWMNFLNESIKRSIPFLFISVNLRESTWFLKPYNKYFQKLLSRAKAWFVVNDKSKAILDSKGFSNVYSNGDTKLTTVIGRRAKGNRYPNIERFIQEHKILLFGSTYPVEHQEISKILTKIRNDLKIIIVPHEIHSIPLKSFSENIRNEVLYWSELKGKSPIANQKILVINAIGLLADLYQYADVVYVGGGFTHGLHNIAEPFAYKKPIVIGPKHKKFPEATRLAEESFCRVVKNPYEIYPTMLSLLEEDYTEDIEIVYQEIFHGTKESVSRIVKYISETLSANG